jgi:hypothetical protein
VLATVALTLLPLADQAVLFLRRLTSMQRTRAASRGPGGAGAASRYACAAGRNLRLRATPPPRRWRHAVVSRGRYRCAHGGRHVAMAGTADRHHASHVQSSMLALRARLLPALMVAVLAPLGAVHGWRRLRVEGRSIMRRPCALDGVADHDPRGRVYLLAARAPSRFTARVR